MQNLIFMLTLVVGSILAVCVGALVIVAVIYIMTTRSNQRELQRVIHEVIQPSRLEAANEARESRKALVNELHAMRSQVDRVTGELQARMDSRAIHAVPPAWEWMTAEAALAAFLTAWDDYKAAVTGTPTDSVLLRLQAVSESVYTRMLADGPADEAHTTLRRKLMSLASVADRSVADFTILGDSIAEDIRHLLTRPGDSQTSPDVSLSNDFIQRMRTLVARG